MKQLLISIIVLTLLPILSFSQGLRLSVGDEFEFRTSLHRNETKENKLDQTSLLESYAMCSYKFKVVKVNADSYELLCDYNPEDNYSRQIPFGESQWQTTRSNHREFHNENTIKSHLGDMQFRLTILKDRSIEELKLLEYNKNPKHKTQKADLTSHHLNILKQYFFTIPEQLHANDIFSKHNTSYTVDSISNEDIFLTYNFKLPIKYTTTNTTANKKEIITFKGISHGEGKVIIDNEKGYIKEIISRSKQSLASEKNAKNTSIVDITTRCVNVINDTHPFTCQYIDDGNKSEATFNNTNVTIRGKIKHPDSHREITIAWNEREPSAYKKMEITVPLNEDNTFEIKLHIDKIHFITLIHKENSKFYIMPGDDLFIEVDMGAFDETIQASGIGAAHVNLCFNKFMFEEKNNCFSGMVGRKLYMIKKTADPGTFESYALSKLKQKQDYLQSAKGMQSPEVYLALFWKNQLQIADDICNYIKRINYYRKKDGLELYDIDEYDYAPLNTLIHADNDLMAFADNYDSFIRHHTFFYLSGKITNVTGRGNTVNVENFHDNSCINNYNYAHMFFTGKTQESLKYSSVNDAMKQASWETYEELLLRYKGDYPHSKRLDLLEATYYKSEKAAPLSAAYDFELQDLNGITHHLSDYKGKAVYINFWSLGCGTDGSYQKNLNKLHEAYQDSNLVIIHILFDGNKIGAQSYIVKYQQKGVFLLAKGQTETLLRREYFFSAVPHDCLIDVNGNIVTSKNNAPYEILRDLDILDDAFHPTKLSVNYQQRSELMTFISLGLLGLLLICFLYFLWHKQRQARQLKLSALNQQLHESELRAIRAQMNPHFTHNCLNSIQNLVQKKEGDKAHLYISKFSSLIRDTLTLSNKQEISLSQEIEMISNYIALENLRFAITFELNVAPEVDIYSIFIPPMLLQPIIENAIIHGLSPITNEKKLSLRVYKDQQMVCIEIKDNGIGRVASLTQQTNGTGKGTAFTNERLELLSHKHGTFCQMTTSDLSDHNKQACGTLVEIKIEDED